MGHRKMETELELDGTLRLVVDFKTAVLIVDALEIIQPDDPAEHQWAEDCAFSLRTAIDRWTTG